MENVMNKIGETAIRTYRCAAEATGKIAREIKLKAQMSDNKSQIRELYEEIGKRVYEKHILQEKLDIELDFTGDCAMIDTLANQVEDIRMELLKLKDMKQCPKCYYEIDLEFHYCPNCGQEQNLSEEVKQNDGPAKIETTDETDTILRKTKTAEYIDNKESEQQKEGEEKQEEITQDDEE